MIRSAVAAADASLKDSPLVDRNKNWTAHPLLMSSLQLEDDSSWRQRLPEKPNEILSISRTFDSIRINFILLPRSSDESLSICRLFRLYLILRSVDRGQGRDALHTSSLFVPSLLIGWPCFCGRNAAEAIGGSFRL